MKNIQLIALEKYNDPSKFEKVFEGIYKALFNYENSLVDKGHYVTTFSFTLEEDFKETVNRQYPLEDLLNKFYAHVSEVIQNEKDNHVMVVELCTQDWFDEMKNLISIVGKHIYNREIVEDGKTYVELVIE